MERSVTCFPFILLIYLSFILHKGDGSRLNNTLASMEGKGGGATNEKTEKRQKYHCQRLWEGKGKVFSYLTLL